MDAKERYFWDLTGFLVVRGVLTRAEIDEANAAIDWYTQEALKAGDKAGEMEGRPEVFGGKVVHTSNQEPVFLWLPEPWCRPFRRMLVHPQVVARLNEMCGKGFRLDHGPELIAHTQGVKGLRLHGSGNRHKPYVAYHHQNETMYCGGVTVSWQFAEARAGDGGFAYVSGSHKSRYTMPEDLQYFRKYQENVKQAVVKPGDVIFFMDGAQTHGTFPWQAEHQRRSVLFKYTSRTSTRQGQAMTLAPPDSYWDAEVVDGMTAAQKAVMWGPYSNYHAELPYLDVAEDGTVTAVPPVDPDNIWSDRRG